MNYRLLTYGFALFLSGFINIAKAQNINDLVQVNGIVMTSDSMRYVPFGTMLVKGQNRGVECSNNGVFSIVVYKGDTLVFSNVGFRSKEFVVPKDVNGVY